MKRINWNAKQSPGILGIFVRPSTAPMPMSVAAGGETILHLGLTTVSLYAPVEGFPLASLAIRLGTPLIDCRPVRNIIAFANLLKVTMDSTVDPEPWTSSSRILLLKYLDLVERLGARIVNDPRINHAT
ncbi:MAG: hypothetical protein ACSHXW_18265 [Yoonia sp.]